MKLLNKRILYIFVLIILPILLSSNTYAQTTYDWTGAVSTTWTTPGNWQVGGVTASNYPGQSSSTDIANIGVGVSYYHFAGPTTTRQPSILTGTIISIAALNFGDNGVPSTAQPGRTGNTGYEETLTVTGTLNVTGAITQNHSTQGIALSGEQVVDATSAPYTYNILNALQGAGTVNCGSLVIGDSTTPTNDYVIGVTKFRVGVGANFTLNVSGDITCNSPIRGDGTGANNIISENFGELSIAGGSVNLTGKIILQESTSTFTAQWSQYAPLAFFSMDIYKNAFGPTLNLLNTSPFSIQTGSVRNNIDFYNVFQSGGTATSTVNYAATSGSQDVATYKATGGIYNNFIDHNFILSNVIATTSGLTGGSGYVDGTYTNVPLTGGTGAGALANIVVSGGAVTSVTLISGMGSNYAASDVLSASNTNLGGSGTGFSITVATVTASAIFAGVYQNLSFSGGGTKAAGVAGGTLSVWGDFSVLSGTETMNISTNSPVFTLYGNLLTGSGATLVKSDATALTINGTTTNGGTFTHSGSATMTFNGAFTNQSTGTYSQSAGGNVVFNNYAINNSGAYNQSSTGSVTINKTFNNNNGGTYNHSGTGAFTAVSTTTNGGTFNQSSSTTCTFTGAVTSTGSFTQTSTGSILFSSTFANSGTSSSFSQTGAATTTFTGAATNDGTITQNNATGILQFNNTFANTNSAALFTLTNGTTNFTNSYSNIGTFKQTGGTVNLTQPTSQSLADNSTGGTTFSNVNVKNGGSETMSGSGQFYISDTGLLNMSNNTTLTTGGILTISSSANGSGTVTAIPSGCQINGNVTAQRYVSSNRAYRLMSSPVYAGTDGNSNKYYGVNYLLTNTVVTGSGSGFNKSGNPTLYLWRENLVPQYTTFLNSNFIGIADISNPASYGMSDATYPTTDIPVGNGYLFYFRGSIKQKTIAQLTVAGATATNDTLNAVGNLNQGTIIVHPWYQPASSNLGWSTVDTDPTIQGMNLVGNPYASSIDWDQFSNSSSSAPIYGPNVSGYSYQLIPTGLQGSGNYNVYLAGTPTKVGTQGTANSNIIASGEGFFVQANNAAASLTFNESAKSNTLNTGGNLYMGKPVATNNFQYLRLQLAMDTINTDGTIIRFLSTAKSTFDPAEDAHYKNGTGKVSFSSLSSDNIPIAFNQLPLALKGDTIHLKVGATASGTYKINVKELVDIPQLYNIYLVDALLKDTTDLRKTNSYSFTINTADATTFGTDRFSIIVNQNPLLQYKLLTFTGGQIGESKHVQLAWTTVNEQNYTNFTVERSNDNGKTFVVAGGMASTGAGQYSLIDKNAQDGDNQYRLKQVDFNNNVTYSDVIHIPITEKGNKDHFTCFPNPAVNNISLSFLPRSQDKTTYDLKISNSAGVVVKYAVLTDTSWQGNVGGFLTGTYLIQVTDRRDNSIIGQTKFVKL